MIAFLILHYKNEKETIECVESIKKLDFPQREIAIFIVDNGSKNESTKVLNSRYRLDQQVHLIYLAENLGFSAGNNAGYAAIHESLNLDNLDFLIVCNSDIVFTQEDFISKIIEIYNTEKFDILGPDIYKTKSNKRISTSPIYKRVAGYTELADTEKVFQSRLNAIRTGEKSWTKIKTTAPSFLIAFRYGVFCIKKKVNETLSRYFPRRQNNVILQGACFIFSNKYMHSHDKLFYPETFLYYEEVILFVRAQSEKIRMIYDPKIKVWHKEGRSTDMDEKKIERYERQMKNRLEALKICREYVERNRGDIK